MNSRKRMFFSHVHLTFSLLPIILTLFVLVPPQNARACNWGGEQQQIGFLLQAPIDSTFTNSSCPTISVLGLSIDTTNAIFGGDDDYNSLHCDTLTAGQVVRITFASDTLTSGKLSATSVTSPTCWDGNQGNVLVSGPIQSIATSSATPPTATSVTILGLAVTIDPTTTNLQSNGDQPLTPASLAALTAVQLAEGQFANVVLASTSLPLTATSLYLRLLETKVVAPIDSTFSSSSCPTISVLGQAIDTSSAIFEGNDGNTLTCSDLQPGQLVKVTLQDQTGPPLLATEVELGKSWWSEDESQVKVIAPLSSISISGLPYTVTVLGSAGVISVDISNAKLVNEDLQPIALGQLIAGQFVEMKLSSNVPAATAPQFVATVVKSLAPGSVVEFNLFDMHGNGICDGRNDVSSTVTFAYQGKGATKTVTLHTTSSGKFSVANLPSGQANVSVTRVNSGQKSNASNTVKVARKTTQSFGISLH